MLIRMLTAALVAGVTILVLTVGPLAPPKADAQAPIGPLTFSSAMNDRFEPIDPRIEFPSDNNGVFVTFSYQNLPPGSHLSRVVRFNGEDYNYDSQRYGVLQCCPQGGSGRYGFEVVRLNGRSGRLPGGAYSVRIYLNGVEVQSGGFGIRGDDDADNAVPGGNNNDNKESNDND